MRQNRIFWGLVIILAGFVLLLRSMGLLPSNFWPFFGPAFLILLGVWFLLAPVMFRSNLDEQNLSIPLEGARAATIHLSHGAGRLNIAALELSGDLMSGKFKGGVEHKVEQRGDERYLKLSAPENFPIPFSGISEGYSWEMGLAKNIPLKLKVKSGASDSDLDLENLMISELKLETGASSTSIVMPANMDFTQVNIDSGAASIKVRIPQGVAARIRVESGLSGIRIDTSRFPNIGNEYQSPDYVTSTKRADLFIKSGVGSVEIN